MMASTVAVRLRDPGARVADVGAVIVNDGGRTGRGRAVTEHAVWAGRVDELGVRHDTVLIETHLVEPVGPGRKVGILPAAQDAAAGRVQIVVIAQQVGFAIVGRDRDVIAGLGPEDIVLDLVSDRVAVDL